MVYWVYQYPLVAVCCFAKRCWQHWRWQVPVALHAQISAWFAPTFSDAPGPASGFLSNLGCKKLIGSQMLHVLIIMECACFLNVLRMRPWICFAYFAFDYSQNSLGNGHVAQLQKLICLLAPLFVGGSRPCTGQEVTTLAIANAILRVNMFACLEPRIMRKTRWSITASWHLIFFNVSLTYVCHWRLLPACADDHPTFVTITKSFMNPANSQALEATIRHVFFPHLDLLRVSLEFFN